MTERRIFRTKAGTFEIVEHEDGQCSAINHASGEVHKFESFDECERQMRSDPENLPRLDDDELRPPAEGLCVCGDPADTMVKGIDFPLCRECAGLITGEDDHLYPDII